MNRNLTEGKPETVLRRYCIPLFASVIFQQLYNLADSFVAGRFVSEEALAAVGNSYEITLIFIAFAFGCNMGCSVIVSRLFGAGDYRRVKTAVTTTLIVGGILCLTLMGSGLLFSEKLLQLIRTPEEILYPSSLYLNIYIRSLPFVFYYNIATGIFSAMGDSVTPFRFLVCSSLANIAMDILFTTRLSHLFVHGVAAVAWATFLCQGLSCILALIFVFRRFRSMVGSEKAPLFDAALLRDISAVAVPSMLQQGLISVGNIVLQSTVNGFGTAVVAGYAASVKLNNLLVTALTTLGNGISAYTAQNLGAGNRERVRQGHRAGIKLVCVLCIPVTLLYFFLPRQLMQIFLDNPSEAALRSGALFLKTVSPFYCMLALKLVTDGVLRGAEHMKEFTADTFIGLFLRIFLARTLSATALGVAGLWLAWPLGWMGATISALLFYRRGEWFQPAAA